MVESLHVLVFCTVDVAVEVDSIILVDGVTKDAQVDPYKAPTTGTEKVHYHFLRSLI